MDSHEISDSASKILVRNASDADMEKVQAIYAHYVLNATATFEEIPPTVEEMRSRRHSVVSAGIPYLVAELDGRLVGYCYATAYRSRSAYRFTIENSVYVENGMGGRGIGKALLETLIARCEEGPWRQMIAVIGNSGNAASIALHRSMGFQLVGTLTAVGFKLGQWVDTTLMQRTLGDGATNAPA